MVLKLGNLQRADREYLEADTAFYGAEIGTLTDSRSEIPGG
jgi:hypothetical protein